MVTYEHQLHSSSTYPITCFREEKDSGLQKKFRTISVVADGRCLYRCMSLGLFNTQEKWLDVVKAIKDYMFHWLRSHNNGHPALRNYRCSEDVLMVETIAFHTKLVKVEAFDVLQNLPEPLWGGTNDFRIASFVFPDVWFGCWCFRTSKRSQESFIFQSPLLRSSNLLQYLPHNHERKIIHLKLKNQHFDFLVPKEKLEMSRFKSAEEVYGKKSAEETSTDIQNVREFV